MTQQDDGIGHEQLHRPSVGTSDDQDDIVEPVDRPGPVREAVLVPRIHPVKRGEVFHYKDG